MRLIDSAPALSRDRRSPASRFLFSFDARDGTIQPRSGQSAATFARASWGSYIDSRGFVRSAPNGRPRWSRSGLGGLVGLLMERATVNYVRASEELSNAGYWTAAGSVTVAAIAGPGLAAHRLTDASAAAQGALTQAVTLPAGWHALSLSWRGGTSAGSVVGCGSVKALVVPDADGSGAPVVTASAGRYLGSMRLADGWWRILLGSTVSQGAASYTVSLAPANSLAGSNALMGTADFAGVMLESWPTPSSYVRSVAGAQGTRAADRLYYDAGWLPRELTLYAETARPAWAGIALPSGHRTVLNVGADAAALVCPSGAAGTIGTYAVGSGSATAATPYPTGALGDRVRSAVRVRGVSSTLGVEVEVEGGATVQSAAVGGVQSAYGAATLGLGCHATVPGNEWDGLIHSARVVAGLATLAAAREGY